jgi:hypothetical protein
MSFKPNDSQQMTLNNTLFGLTDREKRMLDKSWATQFANKIFPLINEKRFSVLYSDKASRPNTPVNVIIGALILKELRHQTDDEVFESLLFDVRYQKALHTENFEEQPISDTTLKRFRKRCLTYETEHGIDLVHECIVELSDEMAKLMKINGQLKRMDSLMVASNIKRLSRMELLYTCVSNLVSYIHKTEGDLKLAGLEHYYDPNDMNAVIYHKRLEDEDDRIQTILDDAKRLLESCNGGYDDVPDYQVLVRVIREQTVSNPDGSFRLRTKEDGGMDSQILQNPADPEATYREKAGKAYRGYAANIAEAVSNNGSVVTDYQFESNTCSDPEFLDDYLDHEERTGEQKVIVTDGAYHSDELIKKADRRNIKLVTTDLTGREARDIDADFIFAEDGKSIIKCPAGNIPLNSSYVKSTGRCRATFNKKTCENCPFREKCNPKLGNKKATVHVSEKSSRRAKSQRMMKTEHFKIIARIRNGVETIPSILRRRYGIDHMPVRGKIKMKHLFGFKIGALNFRKLSKYLDGLEGCAQLSVNA